MNKKLCDTCDWKNKDKMRKRPYSYYCSYFYIYPEELFDYMSNEDICPYYLAY